MTMTYEEVAHDLDLPYMSQEGVGKGGGAAILLISLHGEPLTLYSLVYDWFSCSF